MNLPLWYKIFISQIDDNNIGKSDKELRGVYRDS